MRLVCPNCDAQYEIGEDAIPENGRDVQCSNCGHTWFEAHGNAKAQAEAESNSAWDPQPDAGDPDDRDDPDDTDHTDDPGVAPDEQDAEAEADPEVDTDGDDHAAPRTDLPPRRPLDDGVSAILREEADLEKSARAAETSSAIETLPELGIEAADGPETAVAATVAMERVARLRGTNPEPEDPADNSKRRDLLPDIEEINSTLRSTSDRKGEENEPPTTEEEYQSNRRRGFRRGFSLALIVIGLMFAAYRFSGDLAERFPQLQGYLASYVAMIDGWRDVLDGWALRAAESISAWTDGS